MISEVSNIYNLITDFLTGNITNLKPSEVFFYVSVLMFCNTSIMIPPSEYICLSVGVFSFHNNKYSMPLIIIATIANLLGTYYWYWLGKKHKKSNKTISWNKLINKEYFGKKIILWIHSIYVARLPKIEYLFKTRSKIYFVFIRNVPALRSIVSYPAGRLNMNKTDFILSSFVGILIWVCLWAGLGYMLGKIAFFYKIYIAIAVGVVSILFLHFVLHLIGKSEISPL